MSPLQSYEILERIKLSNLEKYGVENPLQSKEVQEKIAKTNIELHGVANPFSSLAIQEKIRNTNKQKFGFEHPSQNEDIKERTKAKMQATYGGNAPTSHTAVREKVKATVRLRYNVDFVGQHVEFKEKVRTTNFKRRGVYCALKCPLIKLKIKQTNLERHGYENPFTNPAVRTKAFETKLSNGQIWQSKGEQELLAFCKQLDPSARSTMTYLQNKSFQIDVYSPKYNICLEYNGMFWHSEANLKHYPNKHLDKTIGCETQGRRLIHIWESEWLNKREVVQSYIRSVFGLFEERVYARKCELRIVEDKTIVKQFLNDNHLLGACSYTRAIGLYQDEELLGVAVLGRHHRTNVLNVAKRFAFLKGVQVVGGVSKLSHHLLKICSSDSIITWADWRLGAKNVYEGSGWTLESTSKPDYFYWDENKKKVVSKQTFKNHKKSQTGLSEHAFARTQNCIRIFDCGKHRFRIFSKTPTPF